MAHTQQLETLETSLVAPHVIRVQLNRPKRSNAMNTVFWREMKECFDTIAEDRDCRAVIISGAGKNFTGGLDLQDAGIDLMGSTEDAARVAKQMRSGVAKYQAAFTAIEKCGKPVVVAIHGACIGGGVDLITACDIRVCSQNAYFCVKEIDIGLAADVGTLQRLPKVVGNDSIVRELVYTGRNMGSEEALKLGLVSRVLADKEAVDKHCVEMCKLIAEKSPVAVHGSKVNLNYSRDHSVDEGLDYMVTWNMAMLQTEDIANAITAQMAKEKPQFSKL